MTISSLRAGFAGFCHCSRDCHPKRWLPEQGLGLGRAVDRVARVARVVQVARVARAARAVRAVRAARVARASTCGSRGPSSLTDRLLTHRFPRVTSPLRMAISSLRAGFAEFCHCWRDCHPRRWAPADGGAIGRARAGYLRVFDSAAPQTLQKRTSCPTSEAYFRNSARIRGFSVPKVRQSR